MWCVFVMCVACFVCVMFICDAWTLYMPCVVHACGVCSVHGVWFGLYSMCGMWCVCGVYGVCGACVMYGVYMMCVWCAYSVCCM